MISRLEYSLFCNCTLGETKSVFTIIHPKKNLIIESSQSLRIPIARLLPSVCFHFCDFRSGRRLRTVLPARQISLSLERFDTFDSVERKIAIWKQRGGERVFT